MSDSWFHTRHTFRWIAPISLGLALSLGQPVVLNAEQSGVDIVFLAEPQVSGKFLSILFQALHEDLEAGSVELPGGVALDRSPGLMRRDDLVRGLEAGDVIQVTLLGRCDVLPQAVRPWLRASAAPLAWVKQAAGQIQPFIFIDCERLAQVLGAATLGLDREQRTRAMAQAIAHVLIHEWVHVATQSALQRSRGIERASLSVRELITSPPQVRLRPEE